MEDKMLIKIAIARTEMVEVEVIHTDPLDMNFGNRKRFEEGCLRKLF